MIFFLTDCGGLKFSAKGVLHEGVEKRIARRLRIFVSCFESFEFGQKLIELHLLLNWRARHELRRDIRFKHPRNGGAASNAAQSLLPIR